MRGRLFGLLLTAAVLFPATAGATPVLVMGRDGRAVQRNDPFLGGAIVTPAPMPGGVARPPAARAARARGRKPTNQRRTPVSELVRLYRSDQIDQSDYLTYRASWAAALRTARHLHGIRATELGAVIANVRAMAAGGRLTAGRSPALFLTLERNRQWWRTGPLPSTWERVEFAGSQLVWEYYPGQGIELQVLGTFAKADGLYTAGAADYPKLRALLDEMIPLAVPRAGGLAWEYYFEFDGGSPPWTSAMSQGTALEALSRAAKAFGAAAGPTGSQETYLQLAHRALAIFTARPPRGGVRVATPAGAWYLQYSFAPRTYILNAFLQSLIGLYDYARVSRDRKAQRLFTAGNATAQAEVPRFDTGAWSLYQPRVEDSLAYHVLVTGFLRELCARTRAAVYCRTATKFHTYLTTPPTLRLLTTRTAARTPFALRFALSKLSHVGVVLRSGKHVLLLTSADFPYGTNSFQLPSLSAGRYIARLSATDLAGNFTRQADTLRVISRKRLARPQ